MSFMKRMPMWLTTESWKVYADIGPDGQISTPGSKFDAAYGTDIE
jgi:hypothetical protein